MVDQFAISVTALNLIGSLPNYIETWQKILQKLQKTGRLSQKEVKEVEKTFSISQQDYLLHKIILLNLVIAFSKEHVVNPELITYCKHELVKDKINLKGIRK